MKLVTEHVRRDIKMALRRSIGNQSEIRKNAGGEKIRVQFDFTPDAYERLEAITSASGAISRAETVRNALSLYEWFIRDVDPNATIQVL
jgi:hypothetical protein